MPKLHPWLEPAQKPIAMLAERVLRAIERRNRHVRRYAAELARAVLAMDAASAPVEGLSDVEPPLPSWAPVDAPTGLPVALAAPGVRKAMGALVDATLEYPDAVPRLIALAGAR